MFGKIFKKGSSNYQASPKEIIRIFKAICDCRKMRIPDWLRRKKPNPSDTIDDAVETELTVTSFMDAWKAIINPWEGEYKIKFVTTDFWDRDIWLEHDRLNLGVIVKFDFEAPSGRVVYARPRWHFGYIDQNVATEYRKFSKPYYKDIWNPLFDAHAQLLMLREVERVRIAAGDDKYESIFITQKARAAASRRIMDRFQHRYTPIE